MPLARLHALWIMGNKQILKCSIIGTMYDSEEKTKTIPPGVT